MLNWKEIFDMCKTEGLSNSNTDKRITLEIL